MNEQELRALMRALANKSNAMIEGAKAEGRDLTEDETRKIEEWSEEYKQAKTDADAAKAEQEKKAATAALVQSMVDDANASQGRQVPAAASTENKAITSELRERSQDDPQRGYKSPRAYIEDVMRAGSKGVVSEKLRPLQIQATAGTDEHGTFSDPYGGFAVPEGFSPNLLTTMPEDDFMGSRTTKIPMTNPVVKIPARVDKDHSSSVSGGLQVYRRAEADTVSATRMQLDQVRMEANNLMGISYVTEELLQDSPISFAALIASGFNDEFVSKLATERISGTGVGEYEGIDNSGSIISVAKETAQAADTIVTDNILNMRARIWQYPQAIWMANHNCLPQLCKLTIDNGTSVVPIYQFSLQEDRPDLLMGRPIFYTEECATLGDAGDIRLVNWTQYLEGIYENPNGTSSIHVRFVNHERAFKFVARNAGACWWRSALTPKNGSTLSPNVSLAARA